MSGSLWVDPEGLRSQGATFQEIGDQAAQAVRKLKAVLDQQGAVWGDDKAGKEFEKTYKPDADKGVKSLRDIAETLRGFGGQITKAANAYEAGDQAAASRINNAGELDNYTPTNWSPASGVAPNNVVPNGTVGNGATPDAAATNGVPPRTQQPVPVTPKPQQSMPGTSAGNGAQPSSPGGQQPAGSNPQSNSRPQQSQADPGSPGSTTPNRSSAPGSTARGAGPTNAGTDRGTVPPAAAGPVGAAAGSAGAGPSGRPAVSAPGDRKPPSTPWTKPSTPPGTSGGRPSSRPASEPASPGRAGPGKGRAAAAGKDAKRRTPWSPGSSAAIMQLGRDLAERHDLEIVGFDAPELDENTVREYVTGIDAVLTTYPVFDLRSVEIAGMEGDTIVRLAHTVEGEQNHGVFTGSITLNIGLALDPDRLSEVIGATILSGAFVAGADNRPVYSATVREFGSALDSLSNHEAHSRVQRALITEYMDRGGTGHLRDDLSHVTSGYKQWRGQLSSRSFQRRRLDPGPALAEAFTDVMLNGADATAPAKVLHLLLIKTVILARSGRVATNRRA